MVGMWLYAAGGESADEADVSDCGGVRPPD